MEQNSKRIAKNTLLLYVRHIIIVLVSLYTVRIVLNTLGVADYGIYNAIGGIVTFFSFLSASMAGTSQRFFSFELGRGNYERLEKTFIMNCILYSLIAIAAMILLETVGLWFIYYKLLIPPERVVAARWVYQFSALTFLSTIIAMPFRALIIAHEDMGIYAYISIVEAIVKLGMVFLLIWLPWDKLQIYAVLVCIMSIIITIVYIIICKTKYKECQFHIYWEKNLFKEIAEFTGCSLFGSTTAILKNQAVTILLNQFFNPVVVAARAIADQINAQIVAFSSNFNTGLYPPIVKSYAAGNQEQMFRFIFKGSKMTYFLMFIFTLPLVIEMQAILTLWLKNPPEWTTLFAQLTLIAALIDSISYPLMTTAQATGKIRLYELILGCILIASFLISWLVLYLGMPAYSVIFVTIGINVVMFAVRLLLIRYLAKLSIGTYLRVVVSPMIAVSAISIVLSLLIKYVLPDGFLYLCLTIITCIIISATAMYFIGLDKWERKTIRGIIIKRVIRK